MFCFGWKNKDRPKQPGGSINTSCHFNYSRLAPWHPPHHTACSAASTWLFQRGLLHRSSSSTSYPPASSPSSGDCRAQERGWKLGRSCPQRPSLTGHGRAHPLLCWEQGAATGAVFPGFTSGRSLPEPLRAALASQTQQGEKKDGGALRISKKSRLWKASQILLAPRNPQYAAACRQGLKPGQETKPSQLQQPERSSRERAPIRRT